ncbi:MAG: hypothetical protein NZV14_19335 [Bryobacteraceae bacterium]|nr:hypothetical protein [Bryobacteraceae bacterium]MDW8380319.1 hypothetical protein [Bryobacterales bacterium]
MAKIKPAGKKTVAKTPKPGLISCVILILGGIFLLSMLFYSVLKTGIR